MVCLPCFCFPMPPLRFPRLARPALTQSNLAGGSALLQSGQSNLAYVTGRGTPTPSQMNVIGLGNGFGGGGGGTPGIPPTYSVKLIGMFGSAIVGLWPQSESYSAVAGTGTITQLVSTITGTGTAFTTQLQVGDLITAAGISGYVTVITNDNSLTISSSTTVGVGVSFTYTREISTDLSGRNHTGLYRNVTLGQFGIGDGNTTAAYNGTTSFDNLYSAGLNTDFNNAEGTLLAWAQITSAGVWTDATQRVVARFAADANNRVQFDRTSTNNQIRVTYAANSVVKNITSTALNGSLDYFCLAITWSASADQAKGYLNGLQISATQTGLGTWAGALGSTSAIIGASVTTPSTLWSGVIGPVLLLNRAATAAEVLRASTVT